MFEINKTIARDESNAVEKVDQRGGWGRAAAAAAMSSKDTNKESYKWNEKGMRKGEEHSMNTQLFPDYLFQFVIVVKR